LFHQRVHAAMLTRWKSGARGLGVNWDNPTRSDPVRARRQVLCTQSRAGSLRSAAVSAEDQPQHGRNVEGQRIVPQPGDDVPAAATGAAHPAAGREATQFAAVRTGGPGSVRFGS
jgi:hypothetical protein